MQRMYKMVILITGFGKVDYFHEHFHFFSGPTKIE